MQDELSDLLARCGQGDRRAFERLYRLASPRLYTVCLRLLRNESLAADALQEGFVKVWSHAASYNPGKGAPMTWMSSILRNRCLDLLRSMKSAPAEVDVEFEDMAFESQEPGPLDSVASGRDRAALMRCLEALSESQRQSILLAFYHGLTHSELADRLQTPLGTIKAWIRRGMQSLRECLE
ncbi:MAG: sigma-70 family RNA polymerase sigma factor [Gammaproteobacteria bacterium]